MEMWVKQFLIGYFGEVAKFPKWVILALKLADFDISNI